MLDWHICHKKRNEQEMSKNDSKEKGNNKSAHTTE